MLPRQAGYADAKAGKPLYEGDPRSGAGNWDNPSESYFMGHMDYAYENADKLYPSLFSGSTE